MVGLLVLLSTVALLFQSIAGATLSDAELLLAFRDSFDNGALLLDNWQGDDPCGGWKGVSCLEGRVAGINLYQQGLRGRIPSPAGWSLPATLLQFSLQFNSISSTIPPGLVVPEGLQQWDLGLNSLSGTLPVIPYPTSLRELSWRRNILQGPLPQEQQLPAGLRSLKLDYNQFSGEVPPNWVPSSLEELLLSWNQLRGPLPLGLPLPPALRILALDNNKLTGTLNPSWALPRNLSWLDISNNALDGAIPANWTLPSSMNGNGSKCLATCTGLALHNNSLSGTLPTWPWLTSMNAFVLPGNRRLCGAVPATPVYFEFLSDVTRITQNGLDKRVRVTSLPECGSQSDDGGGGGGSSTAAIVGGVVGGLLGTALVGIIGAWFWRRRAGQGVAGRDSEELPSKDVEVPADEVRSTSVHSYSANKLGPSASNASLARGLDTSGGAELGGVQTPSTRSLLLRPGSQQGGSGSTEAEALLASDPLLASIVTKLASRTLSERSSQLGKSASSSGGGSASKGLVDVKLWVIPFEDLSLRRQVGAGSFGRVYCAEWKGTTVAVKLLLGEAASMANVNQAAALVLSTAKSVLHNMHQEAGMLAALRFPHIVSFIGLCEQPPCIITEYCPQGSLYDVLRKARESPTFAAELTWPVRLRIAMGAALGMQYLHSFQPPILHRDVKSPNILIGDNWNVKVSDFNLSKILLAGPLIDGSGSSSLMAGNPRWLAPEVLAGGNHTFASDVYSFGLLLWELLTFQLPFLGYTNYWQVSMEVIQGRRPDFLAPEELPGGGATFQGLARYESLVRRCWAGDPDQRPTFDQTITDLRELCMLAAQESYAADGGSGASVEERLTFMVGAVGGAPIRVGREQRIYRSVRLRD